MRSVVMCEVPGAQDYFQAVGLSLLELFVVSIYSFPVDVWLDSWLSLPMSSQCNSQQVLCYETAGYKYIRGLDYVADM